SRVLNVNQAEIYQWERQSNQLHLLARHQQASWRGGHAPVVHLVERAYVRQVLESRHFAFIQHDRHESRKDQERLMQLGVSAILIIPVLAGDQVLGVVEAHFVEPLNREPTPDLVYRVQRLMLELIAGMKNVEDDSRSFKLLEDVKTLLNADWVEFAEARR